MLTNVEKLKSVHLVEEIDQYLEISQIPPINYSTIVDVNYDVI